MEIALQSLHGMEHNMAKSGIIYGSRAVNAYGPRLELHWSVTSQSVAENTSNIKIISILDFQGWVSYDLETTGSVTAGSTKTYSYKPTSATSLRRTLATTYHTVKHNNDGSLNLTISGDHTLRNFTFSGVSVSTLTASQTVSLDKIIRGIDNSSISFASGWTDVVGTKTITFNKYSTTARVQIDWKYYNGKNQGWSDLRTVSENYISGTQFSFSSSDVDYIHTNNPNSRSVNLKFYIRIYQGTSFINTITRDITLKLKVAAPDVVLTVKCLGLNQSLLASSLHGVKGVHTMQASVSAVAKNGASIASYSISFQNSTVNAATMTRLIQTTGTLPVKATATDTRGFKYTKIINITAHDWSPPSIVGLHVSRYEGNTINPLGTDWKVTATIKYTNVYNSSGSQINKAKWKIGSSSSYTNNATILQNGSLDIESQRVMTLYFSDMFSSDKFRTITIPRGQAPFVLSKKGVGIGVLPPEDIMGLFIKGAFEFKADSNSRIASGSYNNLPYLFNVVSSAVTDGAPPSGPRWGYVIYFKYAYAGFQISFPYSFTNGAKVYARSKNDSGVWNNWFTLSTLS